MRRGRYPSAQPLDLGQQDRLELGLVDVAVQLAAAEDGDLLTRRELEVLQLLAQGLANKNIAQRLKISDHTVKFHVGAIMAKLDAASRTEAVTAAARRGILML